MDAQGNKQMLLENLLIMYGVYNAETLSKLVKNCTSYAESPNTCRTTICRSTGRSI